MHSVSSGTLVGATDGDVLGILLGLGVVGLLVGDEDGVIVGKDNGKELGDDEGKKEGAALGKDEGIVLDCSVLIWRKVQR